METGSDIQSDLSKTALMLASICSTVREMIVVVNKLELWRKDEFAYSVKIKEVIGDHTKMDALTLDTPAEERMTVLYNIFLFNCSLYVNVRHYG